MSSNLENPDALPDLMTSQETAKYLRIPLNTFYYLAQRGQLPVVRIGNQYRLKRQLMDRQLDVVTIATDSGADKIIRKVPFNRYGGLFMRPGNERDEKTDIFVTTSGETDPQALELQENFSGNVVHILANPNVGMPPGHFPTTAKGLEKTLKDISEAIRGARKG